MGDIHGRFLWYQLQPSDAAGAIAFYQKVVGWGTETLAGMDTPYTMFTRLGAPIGGVLPLPEEAKQAGAVSHWLAYIGTTDVDGTVGQATKTGAKICVPAQDIPSVGRFAVLLDPQGALFAVYKPEQEPGAEEPPQNGDCSWHELVTGDVKLAWDFYAPLFGWERKGAGHDMGPLGVYQEYGRPGSSPLGGMFKKPAEMPGPPHWELYFRVDDVNAGAERVKAGGGQILNGPMEVPGGDFIVNCLDPFGAGFSLHHRANK